MKDRGTAIAVRMAFVLLACLFVPAHSDCCDLNAESSCSILKIEEETTFIFSKQSSFCIPERPENLSSVSLSSSNGYLNVP